MAQNTGVRLVLPRSTAGRERVGASGRYLHGWARTHTARCEPPIRGCWCRRAWRGGVGAVWSPPFGTHDCSQLPRGWKSWRVGGQTWMQCGRVLLWDSEGKRGGESGLPLGTTHTPPREMANVFSSPLAGPTSTSTLPSCTKKHICILLLFFARLKPSGGSSTSPEPKNGRVMILAYLNSEPATSRVTMLPCANARSVRRWTIS